MQEHGTAPPAWSREPRPDLWQLWSRPRMLAFGFFLLATYLLVQSVIYVAAGGTFLGVVAGAALGVALPAGLVSLQIGAGPGRDFQLVLPGTGRLAASALVAVSALVPVSMLAGYSERIRPVDEEWVRHLLAQLPTTTGETVLAFVAVTLAAPLAEELIFRGILYRLARGLWGPLPAAALSALAFGLIHFEPWYFFGLVGVGLVFAFVYESTHSLLAAWLAHGVHNACSLGLILADRESLGGGAGILGLHDLEALALSVMGLVVGGVYLWSRRAAWSR
ncbi:MAG: type II CAAX endopeptidase family protein [Candidatus Krumholzibacteriia bacterium]